MAISEGRQRAADAVARELARRQWSRADLKTESGSDPETIQKFLDGERWPQDKTRAKIEKALGWEPGSIRLISLGRDIPSTTESVAPATDTEEEPTLLFRQPDELTNDEWRELIARTQGIVEWEIEQAIRRRRG